MTYRVKLEVFEGPLDLMLFLIKKNELDIYDIPIARITEQYLEYLECLQALDVNIAGEFILMAATLMHIKSKMLLPPDESLLEAEEELDPRAELVARLVEYRRFKEAAGSLATIAEGRKALYERMADFDFHSSKERTFFEVNLFDLISAFSRVLKAMPREAYQEIIQDDWTVEDKIHQLLHLLVEEPILYFKKIFMGAKGRLEVIATFLAVLELVRLKEVIVRQPEPFSEIEIARNAAAMKPA